MPNVDRYESMFRAAERDVYRHEAVAIDSVLVVTDLGTDDARAYGGAVHGFLDRLDGDAAPTWRDVAGSEFQSAGDLLELVETESPSLICTYRNLHSNAWRWPYSLGTHLDLLTQHSDIPVMVLPHPNAERSAAHAWEDTKTVMAVTDHLSGDDRLVNFAARFTAVGGTLWLTHLEDEKTFDRYMNAISKIPMIDTDTAREALRAQLLSDPMYYVSSCSQALQELDVPIRIEKLVEFGHHLSEYKRMIESHRVDLLVLNSKDEDQLAMHGIAYELAVELRQIPLLML